MTTADTPDSELTAKTKIDWSTPYDSWLLPILIRYRHGGAIECRAIPSEIQLHIATEKRKLLDRLEAEMPENKLFTIRDGNEYQRNRWIGYNAALTDQAAVIKRIREEIDAAS